MSLFVWVDSSATLPDANLVFARLVGRHDRQRRARARAASSAVFYPRPCAPQTRERASELARRDSQGQLRPRHSKDRASLEPSTATATASTAALFVLSHDLARANSRGGPSRINLHAPLMPFFFGSTVWELRIALRLREMRIKAPPPSSGYKPKQHQRAARAERSRAFSFSFFVDRRAFDRPGCFLIVRVVHGLFSGCFRFMELAEIGKCRASEPPPQTHQDCLLSSIGIAVAACWAGMSPL